MKPNDPEDFDLTWTFNAASNNLPAEPVAIVSHDLMEALVAFHAEMQLKRGSSPADYTIVDIATNQTPPKRYDRYDLPPHNPDIRQCVFTKRIARKFETEITHAGFVAKIA